MASVIPLIKKIVKKVNQQKTKGRFEKFFLFTLGGKTFSIAVSEVAEVSQVPQIMSIPEQSELITGVVNIRGKVIPIINISKKMSLANSVRDVEKSRLLLLCISENDHIGIIVDKIEYRLKVGILENTDLEIDALNENSVKHVVINGERWPLLAIGNWLDSDEMNDIQRVIATF